MAIMYPHMLSDQTRKEASNAEVRVYDLLRSSLCDEWHVFHSVCWLKPPGDGKGARDGEADFVLMHAEHGIIVLEVKGGRIRYDGEGKQWYSKDRNDHEHQINDPVHQAKRSKHVLKEKIIGKGIAGTIPVAHGAMFPDCNIQPDQHLPPDLERRILFDQSDLSPGKIADILERLSLYFRDRKTSYSWNEYILGKIKSKILAPDWETTFKLKDRTRQDQECFRTLTEEQHKILDYIARNPKVRINGAAGTGKTFLALEKACRLAKAGARTMLVCYQLGLERYLNEIAPDDVPSLYVVSFESLCKEAARRAEIEINFPEFGSTREERTKFYREILPERLLSALGELGDDDEFNFEALVIDEAHDFGQSQLDVIQLTMKDDNGSIYVFADEKQGLLIPGSESMMSDRRFENYTTIDLKHNLRNTRKINEQSLKFRKEEDMILPESSGPCGENIGFICINDDKEILGVLNETIEKLLKDQKMSPVDIAVLTVGRPETTMSSLYIPTCSRLAGKYVTTAKEPKNDHLFVDTILNFKGLEASVVILCGLYSSKIEGKSMCKFNKLMYIGITRATSHLIVLGRRDVLELFQGSS